ncbi:MAG: MFS transporter, partial [Hydrogenophaga sp.]|nr:MFS transporter [Hydrogenophaga sp.]
MPRASSDSLLEPFRGSGFRYLWLAWLSGNMTMWMHEVTAAWRMTQL